MEVLQKINEYYANLTFIVKKVSILKRDLILRADNTIDTNTYTLLSDLKTVMCQLSHNITNAPVNSDISNVLDNISHSISSPCLGMSSDKFYMYAIKILYNFQTVLHDVNQHLNR